jgi:hypothetical protein
VDVKHSDQTSGEPTGYELKDPNSPSRNLSSLPPAPCCVRLCCKSMSYRDDERPGLLHFSDTQPYWCNITMDPCGPDHRHASPKVCQPGRDCFVAEE